MSKTPSGFNAMGHPIPLDRASEALQHLRIMWPDITTEKAMEIVGQMSEALRRDDPYGAQKAGMKAGLDLCGTHRVMSVLLSTE